MKFLKAVYSVWAHARAMQVSYAQLASMGDDQLQQLGLHRRDIGKEAMRRADAVAPL